MTICGFIGSVCGSVITVELRLGSGLRSVSGLEILPELLLLWLLFIFTFYELSLHAVSLDRAGQI